MQLLKDAAFAVAGKSLGLEAGGERGLRLGVFYQQRLRGCE